MKLTIKNKIGLIMLVMTLLIMAAGLSGLYGISALSKTIGFITHQAWGTADGTMESISSLQQELLTTQEILSGSLPISAGRKKINSLSGQANENIKNLAEAGLVSSERIDKLQKHLQAFRSVRDDLLNTYQRLLKLENNSGDNLDRMNVLLLDLDETISVAVNSQGFGNMSAQDTRKFWEISNAIKGISAALLTGNFAFSEILIGNDVDKQHQLIKELMAQAERYVETLERYPFLNMMASSSEPATELLRQYFHDQNQVMNDLLKTHNAFTQQKNQLAAAAQQLMTLLARLDQFSDSKGDEVLAEVASRH